MYLAAVDFLVARPSWLPAGELGRVSVHRTPCGGHLTVETADSVVRLNTYEAGIHTIAAFLDSCYPLWRAQASQE